MNLSEAYEELTEIQSAIQWHRSQARREPSTPSKKAFHVYQEACGMDRSEELIWSIQALESVTVTPKED